MEQGGPYRACPLPPTVQADFVSLPQPRLSFLGGLKTCACGGELRQCPFPLHCDFLQVALVTGA